MVGHAVLCMRLAQLYDRACMSNAEEGSVEALRCSGTYGVILRYSEPYYYLDYVG